MLPSISYPGLQVPADGIGVGADNPVRLRWIHAAVQLENGASGPVSDAVAPRLHGKAMSIGRADVAPPVGFPLQWRAIPGGWLPGKGRLRVGFEVRRAHRALDLTLSIEWLFKRCAAIESLS